MIIRTLIPEDLNELRRIHERDYPDLEFALDRPLVSAFVIEDKNEGLILGGGVEAIAETLIVTDKTKSRIKVGRALIQAKRFAIYTCLQVGIQELHAFVSNESYAKHLIQHGFHERDEKVLRMKLYG